MYCTNCGKEIEQDLMFCDQCGAQLKGQKVMSIAPRGLGGWLVIFQLRLFALAATAVWILAGNTICLIITLVFTISSAVLFYMYNHLFRPMFVAAIIFLFYSLLYSGLQDQQLAASGFIYMDIGIIIALFISKRVRNTFPMPGEKHITETYVNGGQPIIVQEKLVGYYGWLAWFQVDMVGGIVIMLASLMPGIQYGTNDIIISHVIPILSIIPLVVCTVLFYQRKLQFRWAFVVYQIFWLIMFINNVFSLELTPIIKLGIVIAVALQITITIALFRSRRVKNTFS